MFVVGVRCALFVAVCLLCGSVRVAGCCWFAVCCLLPGGCSVLRSVCCLSFAGCGLLFVECRLLCGVVCCCLFIVCCTATAACYLLCDALVCCVLLIVVCCLFCVDCFGVRGVLSIVAWRSSLRGGCCVLCGVWRLPCVDSRLLCGVCRFLWFVGCAC